MLNPKIQEHSVTRAKEMWQSRPNLDLSYAPSIHGCVYFIQPQKKEMEAALVPQIRSASLLLSHKRIIVDGWEH